MATCMCVSLILTVAVTTMLRISWANDNRIETGKTGFDFEVEYGSRGTWGAGDTLLDFLARNKMPQSLYYKLPPGDRESVTDIHEGSTYYTSKDSMGNTGSIYIPISEYAQTRIHVNGDEYKMDIVPIARMKVSHRLAIKIQTSPYEDIIRATGDYSLASEFGIAYRNSINVNRQVKKGDMLVIFYNRMYRNGKYIGNADINSANMKISNKDNFVFGHKNGYYDVNGNEITKFSLVTPVRYKRISSRFSHGRRHPILGIVRPHYGVDYASSTGTPIHAAGSGRVLFSGRKGAYGNVVIISHVDGIKTLYAHISRISRNATVNKYVRQGTVIGYVGSTGLSTGPHLHFGVYKNNKPINPLNSIRTAGNSLKGDERREYLSVSEAYKNQMNIFESDNTEKINVQGHVIETYVLN